MKIRNSTLKFIYQVILLIFLFYSLTSCNKEQNKIKIDLTDPKYETLIGGATYVYDNSIVICPPDSVYVFSYHAAIKTCPYCGVDAIGGVNSKYQGFLFACSYCLSFWTSSGTPQKTPSDLTKPLSLTVYPCSLSGHILTITK
jgi:hypothetical protein